MQTRTPDQGQNAGLCVKCRLQTESKTQAGIKWRPSINCSRGRVRKKIPQMHVNEHLLDHICFHKSIPFFSGTSSTTRKHNRNLEPFFPSERPHASTLDAKFSIHVTVNWNNTTIFTSSETQGHSVGTEEKARQKFSSTGGRAQGVRS